MTQLEYILDGLQSYLELERELGVRVMECDRSLLQKGDRPSSPPAAAAVVAPLVPSPLESSPPVNGERAAVEKNDAAPEVYSFVFIHDRQLSAAGEEMIAKITAAMGGNSKKNPVVTLPPLPKAKIYIALGALALRKFFPGITAAPGQWIKGGGSETVLVTYSPEYILRFGAVTQAVVKIKKDMWNSLKTVVQRLK